MKNKLIFLTILSFLILSGCATNSKFMRLSLGMPKEEAFKAIGKPNTLRASKVNEKGQTVEIYEYLALKTNADWWYSSYTQYWLSFENGKLA